MRGDDVIVGYQFRDTKRHDERLEPVYVDDCECLQETGEAILVDSSDITWAMWVPKSVIHDISDVSQYGDKGTLAVKRWWAEKEGLDD